MNDDKKRNVLNIIFIIIIVAIVGLLIYFGYNYLQIFLSGKEASDFVDNFEEKIGKMNNESEKDKNESDENSEGENSLNNQNSNSNDKNNSVITYSNEQYTVLGTMNIPKINFKYPVLQEQSQQALNKAVVVLFGVGLNQPGNTVVIGHNYRNGKLFSNNKKLEVGDQIFVTDNSGKKLTYTIYDKFEAKPDDASFYVRDTNGVPELTLSTCTDDSQDRLIILAKAE